MPGARSPEPPHVSRRMFLGGVGAAALGISALETAAAAPAAMAAQSASPLTRAGSAIAPRPYFPSDVTKIPATASLPDLFTFFGPNRGGRVTHAAQWPARAAELSDLMQYYLYGYKHHTPQEGSVFRSGAPAAGLRSFRARLNNPPAPVRRRPPPFRAIPRESVRVSPRRRCTFPRLLKRAASFGWSAMARLRSCSASASSPRSLSRSAR